MSVSVMTQAEPDMRVHGSVSFGQPVNPAVVRGPTDMRVAPAVFARFWGYDVGFVRMGFVDDAGVEVNIPDGVRVVRDTALTLDPIHRRYVLLSLEHVYNVYNGAELLFVLKEQRQLSILCTPAAMLR